MSKPLNHLTIYDEGLSDEHKHRFSCLRFFYYVLLILNIATIVSGVVGSVFEFIFVTIIQATFMTLWIVWVVFYVNYPTSSFPRWIVTQIYMMLYSVWTLISIILFPVLIFLNKDNVEERLEENDHTISLNFETVVAIVFILLSFPILLSCIVAGIYFKRRNIALELNSTIKHSLNSYNQSINQSELPSHLTSYR